MNLKRFFTTYTLQFGFLLFILGISLTIFGFFGVFYYDSDYNVFKGIIDSIGDWKYWCILIGPILIISGGWYFYDNISKRREFANLTDTTSKAKFIRNLDRVEFLAWKLAPRYREQLAKKKSEFHIK
ncbi:MAG: DUF3198 domain-containing protein [Thermoplasmata archaeon]